MKGINLAEEVSQSTCATGLTFHLARDDSLWGLRPFTAFQAYRFDEFLRALPRHFPDMNAEARVVLCSIAYEAILTKGDLASFLAATEERQRLPGMCRVMWISHQGGASRAESRSLSARTEMALQLTKSQVDWSAAIQTATEYLIEHYSSHGEFAAEVTLEEVLQDASAWNYLHQPSCIFSHLKGALSMPVLDSKVFQRLGPHANENEPEVAPTLCDAELDHLEESSLDVALSVSSACKSGIPINTIACLKDICSVSQDASGIRLADHLNSKLTSDKLALAAQIISREGWVAATLASWTSFLLTFGSLRLANPTVTTIAAYLSDLLECFAHGLISIGKPPALMTQMDWELLFEKTMKEAGELQRSAALGSLHLWAIRSFGCNPMPHVIFTKNKATRVHSNIIWPAEQSAALIEASSCSRDERVANQCTVLIALGSKGLFRIGDLPSLRTSNITESSDGLRIEIDPARGSHGGKSRAARRVVFIDDAEAVRIILRWRDRRDLESRLVKGHQVLLFGDPYRGQMLYRFGHCTRLVNQILKKVTGSSSVSFHTLRHSSATWRALKLCDQQDIQKAVSPLHLLRHQIGHASANTLWNTYFHLPEFAIRTATDRVESVHIFTATEIAFWIGEKPTARRKQKSRSDFSDADDFYHALLKSKAFGSQTAELDSLTDHALSATTLPRPGVEIPTTYVWVRQAIGLLSSGTSPEVMCSRLSCGIDQLMRLCLAVGQVLRTLHHSGRPFQSSTLLKTATLDYALTWAHKKLRTYRWTFAHSVPANLQTLVRYLEKNGQDAFAVEAALAWGAMQHHEALSLHDEAAARAFLHLLRLGSFPPQAIVARMQSDSLQPTAPARMTVCRRKRAVIEGLMLETLKADIRIESVKPRRGFPKCYLLLGRKAFNSERSAPSAGFCMSEVHGAFFSLCVFHELQLIGAKSP